MKLSRSATFGLLSVTPPWAEMNKKEKSYVLLTASHQHDERDETRPTRAIGLQCNTCNTCNACYILLACSICCIIYKVQIWRK